MAHSSQKKFGQDGCLIFIAMRDRPLAPCWSQISNAGCLGLGHGRSAVGVAHPDTVSIEGDDRDRSSEAQGPELRSCSGGGWVVVVATSYMYYY